MSIATNGKTLAALTKELSLRWEDTKSFWKDAKSEEFERKWLAELMAGVEKSTEVFEQLDKIVAKVRNDCE